MHDSTIPPAGTTDQTARFNQRFGILLCVFYALVYAGFVVISVYDVTLMDTLMPFGLNLAVFYGIGLIVFALILAIIYSRVCAVKERTSTTEIVAAADESVQTSGSTSDYKGSKA